MNPMRLPALLVCLASTGAFAADGAAAPGKTVEDIAKPCAACHGADGNGTNPQYPRLAGQYHDYLARALEEYKSGARQNAIMGGFVKTLSDADIDALSRYYAAMPGRLDDLSRHK